MSERSNLKTIVMTVISHKWFLWEVQHCTSAPIDSTWQTTFLRFFSFCTSRMKPSQAFMTSQVSWSLAYWIGEGFGEAVTAERTLRNTSGSQHRFWTAKTSDGSLSSLEWSFLQIFLSASSSVFLWLRLLFPDFDFDFTFRVPWNTSLECAGAQSLVHGVDSPPSRSHPLLPQQNIPNMFSLQKWSVCKKDWLCLATRHVVYPIVIEALKPVMMKTSIWYQHVFVN